MVSTDCKSALSVFSNVRCRCRGFVIRDDNPTNTDVTDLQSVTLLNHNLQFDISF